MAPLSQSIMVQLKDFIFSGTWDQERDDQEDKFRFILVNAICLFEVIFFCGFGIYDIFQGMRIFGIVIAAVGIMSGLIIFAPQGHSFHST